MGPGPGPGSVKYREQAGRPESEACRVRALLPVILFCMPFAVASPSAGRGSNQILADPIASGSRQMDPSMDHPSRTVALISSSEAGSSKLACDR